MQKLSRRELLFLLKIFLPSANQEFFVLNSFAKFLSLNNFVKI